MTTSPRPIAPASRPALSEALPRVAEMLVTCDSVKVSGSAPYLRTFARSDADFSVNEPVISAEPAMRSWMTGADCTTPSSTTASWQGTGGVAGGEPLAGQPVPLEIVSVRLAQALWPLLLKSTLTIHWPVEVPLTPVW